MSREYQEQFLQEQIDEYEQLIIEHAAEKGGNRNIIKNLEKQKAAFEEKLKDLMAEDKKDDGLTFDELGVDHIFIDEFQYFKNLEAPDEDGSRRGHPDRRLRAGLRPVHEMPLSRPASSRPRRHRRHRNADQQQHGRDVHHAALSSTPQASKPRHRPFRRLGGHVRRSGRGDGNLPRRQDAETPQPVCQVRQSAGTAEDVPLVRRRADGGNAEPPTAETEKRQAQRHRLPDVGSADKHCRTSWWSGTNVSATPRSIPAIDNALKITTDGRKLALDGRMLSPDAAGFPRLEDQRPGRERR